MKSPFNSYDENGYRITITGSRSSRTEDESILYNLRFAHKGTLDYLSDAELLNLYDEFAMSEYWGDNDARFVEFCQLNTDAN